MIADEPTVKETTEEPVIEKAVDDERYNAAVDQEVANATTPERPVEEVATAVEEESAAAVAADESIGTSPAFAYFPFAPDHKLLAPYTPEVEMAEVESEGLVEHEASVEVVEVEMAELEGPVEQAPKVIECVDVEMAEPPTAAEEGMLARQRAAPGPAADNFGGKEGRWKEGQTAGRARPRGSAGRGC